MKKLFVAIIMIAVIVGSVTGISYTLNHYEKECEVVGVNNNVVQCIDNHCNIWTFEDDENFYNVGDKITLEMSTNGTEPLDDDEVKGVK